MTKVKPQFQIFFPLVLVVDNSVCDNGNEEAYASFSYDENGIRTAERNTEEGLTWDFATEDGVITGRQSDDGKNDQFIYDDSGKPTAMLRNGKLYYYITNQMGDVVGMTDADGNLAVENFYDAWGDNYTSAIEECDFDGQTGWDGAYKLYNANPMRYRGYYYDVGIGMYYLQSRYFNPMVNRFFNADDPDIARESKDLAVGMNLFAYCNNDPVNNTDPTGYIGKIDAVICITLFVTYYIIEDKLKMDSNKTTVKCKRVLIDKYGNYICTITYRNKKHQNKKFVLSFGDKDSWANECNINLRLNKNFIDLQADYITNEMLKGASVSLTNSGPDVVGVNIASASIAIYLASLGIKTNTMKKYWYKAWGTGKNAKKRVVNWPLGKTTLFYISNCEKKLKGWYAYNISNGKVKQL